ncbi:MAG TPA: nucleotidyl transferase AbiEii/AbiGii toxin family protein [Opitutaceae bacterium]|nr:nucleotidyl transferase AbiEii/AbiGii toxin family protein [Opitutaceae bacterium]
MFHPRLDVLPAAQRALWPRLAEIPPHFVLYGGTAVALRCAHRTSEDFDFFSAQAFSPESLLHEIPWLHSPEPRVLQRQDNTLTVEVAGEGTPVKVSFFGTLDFGQIRVPDIAAENHLKVASEEDLLALKLAVIHKRIEAKDYLDIRALLRAGQDLAQALAHLDALHPLVTNSMIVLKTLTYFKGGDLHELPDEVKRDIEAAVRGVRDVPEFSGKKTSIGWTG